MFLKTYSDVNESDRDLLPLTLTPIWNLRSTTIADHLTRFEPI